MLGQLVIYVWKSLFLPHILEHKNQFWVLNIKDQTIQFLGDTIENILLLWEETSHQKVIKLYFKKHHTCNILPHICDKWLIDKMFWKKSFYEMENNRTYGENK